MMRFRLHLVAAVMGAILLLPSLALAQEAPAAPDQKKASQENTPDTQEKLESNTPQQVITSGPFPVMSQAAEDRGRQIFQMFNHTQTSEMWASLTEGLRKRAGTEARFAAMNKKLRERMGLETEMVEETLLPSIASPVTVYSRLSNFANMRIPMMTVITINQRGQIDGFVLNPMPQVAEGRFAGYHDTAKLKLPFSGEWLVYQGGRNAFDNSYATSDELRFAMDFVYLKNGQMFTGKGGVGSKNEDYYCFGQPILAAADGTVARAEGGYDDNPPGRPSGDPPEGNVVSISHGNGETSYIDHLKQNSIKVKRGDAVKAGDVIAQCGNSGSGIAPHVHYELQRSPGQLLPAQFVDYIADGKPVALGEPKRGQFVKNAPGGAMSTPAASSEPMKGEPAKKAPAGNAAPSK